MSEIVASVKTGLILLAVEERDARFPLSTA